MTAFHVILYTLLTAGPGAGLIVAAAYLLGRAVAWLSDHWEEW